MRLLELATTPTPTPSESEETPMATAAVEKAAANNQRHAADINIRAMEHEDLIKRVNMVDSPESNLYVADKAGKPKFWVRTHVDVFLVASTQINWGENTVHEWSGLNDFTNRYGLHLFKIDDEEKN